MKTIEEIAIECATKSGHSYTNVENFIPHQWVLEAMTEYGKQIGELQKIACAENAKDVTIFDIDAARYATTEELILSTPNVVDK